MSADDLWCSWCRQPHAPCATTPAMEAERAATLRARLEKRYERPERPCTYDPADEEPEAEPVSRVDIEHRWTNPEAPPLTLRMEYEQADWTPPRPEPIEYDSITPWTVTGLLDFPAVAPQGGPDPRNDVRGPSKKRFSEASARADEIRRHPLTGTSTWDTLTLPPGGDAFEVKPDGTPHTCPTVEPPITDTTDPEWVRQIHGAPPGQPVRLLAAGSADDYTAEMAEHRATIYRAQGYTDVSVSVYRPEPQPPREECPACGEYGWHDSRCDLDSYHLRSYLRTLTNPDATPEDVNGALDALTPEDRALVSEALPSWGSARMARVEAIAPFMARFRTMVRERDPRANEEGALILSALREDDPTRSTVEALMEIAKTPKVTP